MKNIATLKSSTAKVVVKFNSEYDEYVCKLYKVVGYTFKHQKGADYFTSDRQDAFDTGHAMLSLIKTN